MKNEILSEIKDCFYQTDDSQIQRAASAIRGAKRIFIQGKGRMGLILKSFAMSLSALGREVYAVGEVTVPAIGPGDLLIVTPTGGDPKSATRVRKVARENGAGWRPLRHTAKERWGRWRTISSKYPPVQ
jgi:6-phospho-3-hexuloisomerase